MIRWRRTQSLGFVKGNTMFTKFIFWPIGQGLFYTGQIGNFNFIFDCGSLPNIRRIEHQVERYTDLIKSDNFGGKTIDLFVLSHFDLDHVNGIPHLLRSVKEVDIIVLPYLPPIQRLYHALFYFDLIQQGTNYDWYFDFLGDPITYFRNNEATRNSKIVFINRGENEDDIGPPDDNIYNPVHSDRTVSGEGKYILKWEHPLRQTESSHDDLNREGYTDSNLFNTFLANHSLIARLLRKGQKHPFWIFKFYCSPANLGEFNNCIKRVIGAGLTRDELISILRNDHGIKKLRECYTTINKRLNATSLALMHFPVIPLENIKHAFHGGNIFFLLGGKGNIMPEHVFGIISKLHTATSRLFCKTWYSYSQSQSSYRHILAPYNDTNVAIGGEEYLAVFGQLLFGDMNLKAKHKYRDIINHFHPFLDCVYLIQVPHHGSGRNWNSKISDSFGNCLLWVASFGLGNRYGHPDNAVIDAILSNNRIFLSSTEANGFGIIFRFCQ